MGIISFVVTVASSLYQRQQAKKAKKKADKAADERKGFEVPVEGEIGNVPVIYGRAKIGGNRVYHAVRSHYEYNESWVYNGDGTTVNNVEVFLSTGGDRFLVDPEIRYSSQVVTEWQGSIETISGIGTVTSFELYGYVNNAWLNGASATNWTIHRTAAGSVNSGRYVLDVGANINPPLPIGTSDSKLFQAGGIIQLVHAPLASEEGRVYKNEMGEVVSYTTPVTHTYYVHSYNSATGVVELSDPRLNIGKQNSYRSLGRDALNTSWSPNYDDNESNKRNLLFVTQVISYEGLNEVMFVDIDEKPFQDPEFGPNARIHIHKTGNVSDQWIRANVAPDLDAANFPGVAHANMAFFLNRDEPQFNGIPDVKFYVEGMKLNTPQQLIAGSGAKTYSNNAADVLLDYLTNDNYGQGLPLDKIDLDSFSKASAVCGKIMPVGLNGSEYLSTTGKFWSATDPEADGTTLRQLKRYEFNGILDTGDTVRDNIKTILRVIDQGYLIWSGGKYKLNLIYPEPWKSYDVYSQGEIVQYTEAGFATSVDIYRRTSGTSIAGQTPTANGGANWEVASVAIITDADILVEGNITQGWPRLEDKLNYATVRFYNELEDFEEDSVSWPKKFPVPEDNDNVYSTYIAQDLGIKLEDEVFMNGITDIHHARAFAEEMVRASRHRSDLRLLLDRTHILLEPGDVIKVNSVLLSIPNELLQVEQIEVLATGSVEIFCRKFDANAFAWNAPDNEVVVPRNVYAYEKIGQARNLSFSPYDLAYTDSIIDVAGIINWDAALGNGGAYYDIAYLKGTKVKAVVGAPWIALGSTSGLNELKFPIPKLRDGVYTFTVITRDREGNRAVEYNPDTGSRWPLAQATIVGGSLFNLPVTLFCYMYSTYDRTGAGMHDSRRAADGVTPIYSGVYYINFNAVDFTLWEHPIGTVNLDSYFIPFRTKLEAKQHLINLGVDESYIDNNYYLMTSRAEVSVSSAEMPLMVDGVNSWSPWELDTSEQVYKDLEVFTFQPLNGLQPLSPIDGTGSYTFPDGPKVAPTGAIQQPGDYQYDWGFNLPSGGNIVSYNIWRSEGQADKYGKAGLNTNTIIWSVPEIYTSLGVARQVVFLYRYGINLTTIIAQDSVQSQYNWYSGVHESLSQASGRNWSLTLPTQDGSNNSLRLYVAEYEVVVNLGFTGVSTINWRGVVPYISDGTELPGVRTAKASVWKFAATIPSGPTGNGTWTWSTEEISGSEGTEGSVTSTHAGWYTEKPDLSVGSGGQTLWEASVLVRGGVGTLTNSFNWVIASVVSVGYVASDGGTGGDGDAGASTVSAYTVINEGLLFSGSGLVQTGAGLNSVPSSVAVLTAWGQICAFSKEVPNLGVNQRLWMTMGSFDPNTGIIVWDLPFWASLKVGSLSAITANFGEMTSGIITLGNTGHIKMGEKTGFSQVGYGMWMGMKSNNAMGFLMGTGTQRLAYDSSTGILKAYGLAVYSTDAAGNEFQVLRSGVNNSDGGVSYTNLYDPTGARVKVFNDPTRAHVLTCGPFVTTVGDLWIIPSTTYVCTRPHLQADTFSFDTVNYYWQVLDSTSGYLAFTPIGAETANPWDTTYIKAAAVDTLKIRGFAVTVPVTGTATGHTNTNPTLLITRNRYWRGAYTSGLTWPQAGGIYTSRPSALSITATANFLGFEGGGEGHSIFLKVVATWFVNGVMNQRNCGEVAQSVRRSWSATMTVIGQMTPPDNAGNGLMFEVQVKTDTYSKYLGANAITVISSKR